MMADNVFFLAPKIPPAKKSKRRKKTVSTIRLQHKDLRTQVIRLRLANDYLTKMITGLQTENRRLLEEQAVMLKEQRILEALLNKLCTD